MLQDGHEAVQTGGDSQDGPLVGGSGQLTEKGFGGPVWTWLAVESSLYPGGHSPCSLSPSVFSSWERPTEERDPVRQISESAGGEAPNLCFLP